MEHLTVTALEAELKGFFDKEYRKDLTYRFCLLFSQLGDLFHYLTHDHLLNPKARSWGSKEDEKGACAQALMQFLMLITIVRLPIKGVFEKAFKLHSKTSYDVECVERSILKMTSKISRSFSVMELLIKTNECIIRLKKNPLNLYKAAAVLRVLTVYINVRGFGFKEVLSMGLQNQRDRDWAIKETRETDDNKLYGIVGIPGVARGRAYVVDENHPLSDFSAGDILVTEHAKAEQVEKIYMAGGVVTDNGGITSHMVNILLPKNITCLVGTGSATKKIRHGQEVIICALEGSNGYVQY